ncbi:hypothetical protein C8R48DRAFT_763830 [Suillus tomentosus]|nr:hypothetical protein C8R48DRAFT_763830 [Suillus tomentosus]
MAPGPNLKSGSGFGANQNRFGRVRTPPRLSSVSAYITSILLLLLQVPDSYWLVVSSRDLHASQVSKQRPQAVNKGLARYGNGFWDADTNPCLLLQAHHLPFIGITSSIRCI